jgi:hypothetical protein
MLKPKAAFAHLAASLLPPLKAERLRNRSSVRGEVAATFYSARFSIHTKQASETICFILEGTLASPHDLYTWMVRNRPFTAKIGEYVAPLERNCRTFGNPAALALSEYLSGISTAKAICGEQFAWSSFHSSSVL